MSVGRWARCSTSSSSPVTRRMLRFKGFSVRDFGLFLLFCAVLKGEMNETELADYISDTMNADGERCDDFYDYVCGGWLSENAETEFQSFYTSYGRSGEALDTNARRLKDLLEDNASEETARRAAGRATIQKKAKRSSTDGENEQHEQTQRIEPAGGSSRAIQMGKNFYQSCMTKGRQFDQHGNKMDLWTTETVQNFQQRTPCFADQYGQEEIADLNITVDGNATLNENLEDNLAIKAAYLAYKLWENDHGAEPQVESLDFNHDQLFFIAFGQTTCTVYDPSHWYVPQTSAWSKPSCNVPVSNVAEFASVFSCPNTAALSLVPRGQQCEMY